MFDSSFYDISKYVLVYGCMYYYQQVCIIVL